MGPDEQETAEDQVTGSSESGGESEGDTSFAEVREGNVDEVVAYAESHPDEAEGLLEAEAEGKDRKGVREGIEKGMADAELESADSDDGPAAVDAADLVCTVHGGELRQAPGKWRWICDRTQEPGECVAGYRS